jgi:hypothetical protein
VLAEASSVKHDKELVTFTTLFLECVNFVHHADDRILEAACGQNATQSSTLWASFSQSLLATLAVDGNYQTSYCTSTENQPWIAIDLARPCAVRTVNITNDFSTATRNFSVSLH